VFFLFAFALVAATSFAVSFTLRLNLPATLLAAYLVGSAEVVLGAEALSLFHAIGVWGYFVWEAVLAVAAVVVWSRAGWPRPSFPRVGLGALRRHPMLVALGLAVGAALVFELVLATTTVPNNWDAMTYHLSRAAAWYQHGSLAWLNVHTPRENIFPPNAEIEALYTMVFTHGDFLTGLPQFIAELATLVGIFGAARRIGSSRSEAMFASFVFATLSEVVLQATSAQNDLVVTAYVVAAAYFLLGRTRVDVVFAGLALGLALGTKFTAVYALPVLALIALFSLRPRRIVELAAACAFAFAAVGSLVYAENVVHSGDPLGPMSVRAPLTPPATAGNAISTSSRILWNFVDLSGYAADIRVRVTLQNTGIFLFDKLGINAEPLAATQTTFFFIPNTRANEDLAYFGPLGALLILPLAFGYVFAFLIRRTDRKRFALALALPIGAIEIALTYKYNGVLGRFMVVPVALGSVLVARVYATRVVSAIFAVIGVIFLAFAIANNERKPFEIWSLDRAVAQTLTWPKFEPRLRTIAAVVPQDARVGVVLGDEDWDYPLYGPHFTRTLVPLPASDPLGAATRLGLDWVVLGNTKVRITNGWTGVHFIDNWDLLAPQGSAQARTLAHYLATATAKSESPNGSLSASSVRKNGTSRS
jgi:hypothetical protein